jgi:hypothetical protein
VDVHRWQASAYRGMRGLFISAITMINHAAISKTVHNLQVN